MTAILRIVKQIVAYGDASVTQNPRLRFVDWQRDLTDLRVQNPRCEAYVLAAGASRLIFNGLRTLSLDGTTSLSVGLVSGTTDRYQFRYVTGTNPVFRTARALNLSGSAVTITINANSTATFSVDTGSLASVVVGDTLWIPGSEESISSPFHVGNQGFWTVLSKTSTSLTLSREGDFMAAEEAGTAVSAANQVQAFSAAGVQVGDKLDVSAGFVSSTLKTFPVVAVTSKYVEVSCSESLPSETGILPTAAGFIVYTDSKAFLYVESDQEAAVQVNGDSTTLQRISPWLAGDNTKPGSYERTGPTWSLTVVNRSPKAASIVVVSAE